MNCGTVPRMNAVTYPTIEDAIGKTPLVALQRIAAEDNRKRGNVSSSASWKATTLRVR
jgi:hypothetical protein